MSPQADWQKGFDLTDLRALAEPFRVRHKPHVFGAFGLTKERDIADARAHKRILWTGDPPMAVALFAENLQGSEQRDFTQRNIGIPAGVVIVKAFAALGVDAGCKVLTALMERAHARLALEIFEEDAIARECARKCGLDHQFTKISAGSEIKGIYAAQRLADPLPPEEEATLTILEREFLSKDDHAAILGELEGHNADFAQHYSDYNKRKSWTSFALRGYSDDPHFIIKPREMSKDWKTKNAKLLGEKPRPTRLAEKFPATMRVVESLGLELDRVRFMRLRSKDGELGRHADITDREAGTRNGFVTRLHIPIRTSTAVRFFAWTARGEMIETILPERSLCYLDQRKPHSVKNNDPKLDRIHLVIDCIANANIRTKISEAMVVELAKAS